MAKLRHSDTERSVITLYYNAKKAGIKYRQEREKKEGVESGIMLWFVNQVA